MVHITQIFSALTNNIYVWCDAHKKSLLVSVFGISLGELLQKTQTMHIPPIFMEAAEFFSRSVGGCVGAITILSFVFSLFKRKKKTDEV